MQRNLLLTTASVFAISLCCATGANAQTASGDAQGGDVETVQVTASRISRPGFDAPTPVTSLNSDELLAAEPSDPVDALRELPILAATTGPVGSTGSQGNTGTYLNLRRLGANNTLVLLDGNRFVPTTTSGTVDTALFPELLISRVDVVTGGASADYGSDAVAGVVNFHLDTEFTGLKGDIQGGVSTYGDSQEFKGALAYGTSFGGGRGHLLLAGEYFNNTGIYDVLSRPLANRSCVPIAATSGPTARTFACDVTDSQANFAGIISAPAAFKGITFDANGQPIPFNYGSEVTSTTMVGGGGIKPYNGIDYPGEVPLQRQNLFSRVSWDIGTNTTFYLEGLYGAAVSNYQIGSINTNTGNYAFTVNQDNAYLPASLKAQMVAMGVKTLTDQRFDTDAPRTQMDNKNYTERVVAGLTGRIDDWTWKSHYEHGENQNKLIANFDQNYNNYALAADAVVNPANGEIACRSTLTNPTNGCVPIDIFGQGQPLTAAQLAYVTYPDSEQTNTTEDDATLDVNGDPFSLWAGPVSIATGFEWRREAFTETADPISAQINTITALPGPLRLGNYVAGTGAFQVTEGYVETVVPLAKDLPFVQNLDFNGAVRVTNYSTHGNVFTWKAGLSYAVNDDLRFRGTQSRDVRAGTLSELFATQSGGHGTVIDYVKGPAVSDNNIPTYTSGNPNLAPEVAETTTLGVVYQPHWLPGLQTSIDAYRIDISNAIVSLSASQIAQACSLGNADSCSHIVRDSSTNIVAVYSGPENSQAVDTEGVDFEASYGFALTDVWAPLSGDIRLRGLANYVSQFETKLLTNPIVNTAGGVVNPMWRETIQAFYDNGPWSMLLQTRNTGDGFYDKSTASTDLVQYKVGAQWLVDVNVSYDLPGIAQGWTAFVNVEDLFNDQPPPFSSTSLYNVTDYDFVGRMFRTGFRFKY
jgi:outer membrane receptor protein involved in Fe transport